LCRFVIRRDRIALAEVAAVGGRLDIRIRSNCNTRPIARGEGWYVVVDPAEINDEGDRTRGRTRTAVMAIVGLVLVVACTNLANSLARASSRQHRARRRALGACARLMLDGGGDRSAGRVRRDRRFHRGALAHHLVFVRQSPDFRRWCADQLRVDFSTVIVAAASVIASLVVFDCCRRFRSPYRPPSAAVERLWTAGHLRWRARRVDQSVVATRVHADRRVRGACRDRSGCASGIDVGGWRLPSISGCPCGRKRARGDWAARAPAPTQPARRHGRRFRPTFGTNFTPQADLALPGQASTTNRFGYTFAPFIAATPSIFATLGVDIVRGRPFDERDNAGAPLVIVLSEQTARQVFGSTDIVGRPVELKAGLNMSNAGAITTLTIVGIASDTDTASILAGREAQCVPLAQLRTDTGDRRTDVRRPRRDSRTVGSSHRADPDLVVDRPAPAAMMMTGAYVLIGVVSRGAGGLALLALVLAMAGLFGVLSHLVARRTREMGLRMALGADPIRIRRLIIGDGLRPVLAGIGVGWAVGLLVRFLLRAAYTSPLSVNWPGV
jgi:hypothetical protein